MYFVERGCYENGFRLIEDGLPASLLVFRYESNKLTLYNVS